MVGDDDKEEEGETVGVGESEMVGVIEAVDEAVLDGVMEADWEVEGVADSDGVDVPDIEAVDDGVADNEGDEDGEGDGLQITFLLNNLSGLEPSRTVRLNGILRIIKLHLATHSSRFGEALFHVCMSAGVHVVPSVSDMHPSMHGSSDRIIRCRFILSMGGAHALNSWSIGCPSKPETNRTLRSYVSSPFSISEMIKEVDGVGETLGVVVGVTDGVTDNDGELDIEIDEVGVVD